MINNMQIKDLLDLAHAAIDRLNELITEDTKYLEDHIVGWEVWAGVLDKKPVWPPHQTREGALEYAKLIKSNTEVRPIFRFAN
jgi:hypothetical protein